MKSSVVLLVFASLAAVSNGLPANDENRVRLERPSTVAPPELSECDLVNIVSDNTSASSSNCGSENQNSTIFGTLNYNINQEPTTPKYVSKGNCTCVQYYLCNDSTNDEYGEGLIDISIQYEECDSYWQKCCDEQNILPDKPQQRPSPPMRSCGKRNVDGLGFRITGNTGNEAQYGEFPWMVAIVRPDETLRTNNKPVNVYQCGGSLIHPQVVLTAVHCVKGKNNLVIRAGEWDTQTKKEPYPTQDRVVREVIIHEQFSNLTLANNVALLILESPVDMTVDNVGLICLPEANENMDGRDCVANGWGKDVFGKEGKYQVILKKVEVPIVPRDQCLESLRKTRLGQRFRLHESYICAGGIVGKDTCKGDGGSPLVCPTKNNPNVYVQAGIVAWGIDCGKETPWVYVNVPHFTNWIDNTLQARGIDGIYN